MAATSNVAARSAERSVSLFWTRRFIEVETAILDDVYRGAEARPFTTSCHALDRDLFMRISPELMLKRLVIGGMERVFEIGKQFRNEGLSARHHPEFTSIEVYQAYADHYDMMQLTEEMLRALPVNPAQVESRLTAEPVMMNLCAHVPADDTV